MPSSPRPVNGSQAPAAADPYPAHTIACAHRRDGQCVIPIRLDGSKAPAAGVRLAAFYSRLPTQQELAAWFKRPDPYGLAVVGGAVSGNMELADIDNEAAAIFPVFRGLVEQACPGLWPRLCVVQTPRQPPGFHVRWRCREIKIPRRRVVASDPSKPPDEQTLIEIRGESCYTLTCGSPGAAHETGGQYTHISGPKPWALANITADERAALIGLAESFDRRPPAPPRQNGLWDGETPLNDFDLRGWDWEEILGPSGWACVGRNGDYRVWRRPGKDSGCSATTGFCRGNRGEDLLHVFSSSAAPFKADETLGKGRAYARLFHKDDWSAAATALRAMGFGGGAAAHPGRGGQAAASSEGTHTQQGGGQAAAGGVARMAGPQQSEGLGSAAFVAGPADPLSGSPPAAASAGNGQAAASAGNDQAAASALKVMGGEPTIGDAEREGSALAGHGPRLLTDGGNAECIGDRYGTLIRYCPEQERWLKWAAVRWRGATDGEMVHLAWETMRRCFQKATTGMFDVASGGFSVEGVGGAAGREREERLKELQTAQRHYLRSEGAAKLRAAVELARCIPQLRVRPESLDRGHYLLNCPNGTVDLRTGWVRPHSPADLITKLCPIMFNTDAKCPLWEAALLKIFRDDVQMIAYVQRLLGYCLTGDVKEQILPILWGGGGNGKSLIVNAMIEILGGDYAMTAARDLLVRERGDRHPTVLADLFGKRFVACMETDEGGVLAESLVKQLTGTDPIRARHMRKDYWQFLPTHKIILCTNHRPEVRGGSEAIWRRLRLVPFRVSFGGAGEERDKGGGEAADLDLQTKLRGEAPGILAWLVRGCLDWQRIGMREPQEVTRATQMYRLAEDVVGAFLEERCRRQLGERIGAAVLYEAYKAWETARGDRQPVTQTQFGRLMCVKGFEWERKEAGRFYPGLTLKTPFE